MTGVTSPTREPTTMRTSPRALLRYVLTAAVLLLPGCVVFTCRV